MHVVIVMICPACGAKSPGLVGMREGEERTLVPCTCGSNRWKLGDINHHPDAHEAGKVAASLETMREAGMLLTPTTYQRAIQNRLEEWARSLGITAPSVLVALRRDGKTYDVELRS